MKHLKMIIAALLLLATSLPAMANAVTQADVAMEIVPVADNRFINNLIDLIGGEAE